MYKHVNKSWQFSTCMCLSRFTLDQAYISLLVYLDGFCEYYVTIESALYFWELWYAVLQKLSTKCNGFYAHISISNFQNMMWTMMHVKEAHNLFMKSVFNRTIPTRWQLSSVCAQWTEQVEGVPELVLIKKLLGPDSRLTIVDKQWKIDPYFR